MPLNHDWAEATCLLPKTCKRDGCGATDGSAKGHSFSDKWLYDDTYHWHGATCEHTDAVSDKVVHNLASNGQCIVCDYISYTKLNAPVIDSIEYDKVSWSAVDNAISYTVTVNEDYTYTTASLSANLADVKYNGTSITTAGIVSITVQANGSGNYLTSDKSSASSYYYVPEKQALSDVENELDDYGIGYGYNLIENEPVDLTMTSQYSVINIAKLLTLGQHYKATLTEGTFDSYNYSSVDDLMSHLTAALDANLGFGIGPKNAIGEIKGHFKLDTEVDKSKYLYNEVHVVQEDFIFDAHSIKNYSIEDLKNCLTVAFQEDLKSYTPETEDAWLKYMYDKYGTHVILGVARGASYTAEYIISTNNESVAADVKEAFDINGSAALTKLLKMDMGLGFSMEEDYNWKGSETEAHFKIFWKGSTAGGTPTIDNLDSAISNFEHGITGSNAAIIGFTTDGAISIGSLISLVYNTLGEKFENYVNAKGDAEYQELYNKYTKPTTLPVTVTNENGENVLRINLSSYQNGGSLGNAYNANLLNGIFTVYPKMMGKTVDKIVITGAFDKYNNNLIDKFSVKLAKTWNKDIMIEVENLGVVCASNYGLVDTSDVSAVYDITLKYTGVNAIQKSNGSVEFHSTINSKNYDFELAVGNEDSLDFTTIDISNNLRLPLASKIGYDFIGWYSGSGVAVTDNKGYVLNTYTSSNIISTIYPRYTPASFRITLDHEGADSYSGNGYFFIKVNDGAYEDFNGTASLLDKKIPIPTKTGFSFMGYYASVKNNSTVNATGEGMYVDENGYITSYAMSNEIKNNITVYAMWIPAKHTITLNNNGADSIGTTVYYTQYKVGIYADKSCVSTITKISLPTKNGYTFAGYYDKDGNQVIDANGNIDASISKNYTSDRELHAEWTSKVYTITLDATGADFAGTKTLAVNYGVGIFSDINCTSAIYKITIPQRTGYTFNGYYRNGVQYIDKDGNIVVDSKAFSGNTTLTPSWTVHTYTVRYFTKDGYCMQTTKCTYGEYYYTYYYQEEDWRFICWNSNYGSFNNGERFSNLTSENNVVIDMYAVVEIARYTVHFMGNGATGGNMSNLECNNRQDYQLPANQYTRIGYAFVGWSYNGTTYRDQSYICDLTLEESDVYLYAIWEKVPDNRITFYLNGGTNIETNNTCLTGTTSKTVTYTAGTTYTIPYKASKTGKTFRGWATSRNGSPIYQMGDTLEDVGTIELYAIFS